MARLAGRLLAAMDGAPHTLESRLFREVREAFPRAAVRLMPEVSDFDLDVFADRTRIEIEVLSTPAPETRTAWLGPEEGLEHSFDQGARAVTLDGVRHLVFDLRWAAPISGRTGVTIAVSPDEASSDAFLLRVAEEVGDVRAEVLVFNGDCWTRDRDAFTATQAASFDDLVLPEGTAERILSDFRTFLDSREVYAAHGIAWRRGALFAGPPGNGKTHCIKALVRALGVPCLLVQSFRSHGYGADSASPFRTVFQRARRLAPCVLVLEDLDALVTATTRAYLLAELDGIRENTGVIVIASTNHPERLDPALAHRPSRFDRVYRFGLPEPAERRRWLERWDARASAATRLGDDLERVVAATEGFSFAYLKELMVGALLRWLEAGGSGRLGPFALADEPALRLQMAAPDDAVEEE